MQHVINMIINTMGCCAFVLKNIMFLKKKTISIILKSILKIRKKMKHIKGFLSKLTLKSDLFILFLTLYFGFILDMAFWAYVFNHVEITDFSTALFVFSLFFFILTPLFWIFSLVTVPYVGKPIIIFFLLVSSVTNYLMYTYGVYIDTNMIRNVFETNTREALDLFTFSGGAWVLITGIIPSLLIARIHIVYRPFWRELKRRLIMIVCGVLAVLIMGVVCYKDYAAFGRNNRDVRKLLNVINYTYSTVKYFKLQALSNRQFMMLDENAKLAPLQDHMYTVLIYVVGETARAQSFSLGGYARKTNPLLEKQDIVYFDSVASCGTATATSLPCMFSNLTRDGFDVNDAKYTQNLLDLLESGKYNIIWRENDDGCKGVCDRVEIENMVEINNPKYCKGTYCHDDSLLDGLEEKLKNIKGDTVIVLHTMGSHGPTYYNRYPDEFKKFTPTCDTADIQNCTQESIVNTYDNTILYTDHIVSSAIDILKKFPQYESGLIYVSDHGESLGENNLYLHGLPYNIAPKEQTQVPMLLWMSSAMKKYDYVDYDCLKNRAKTEDFSHDNLFHSILGLLEIKTNAYKVDMDIFSGCRTKKMPF